MHRHGLDELHVELLAARDLLFHAREIPALLRPEQPGGEVEHALDPHASRREGARARWPNWLLSGVSCR
jgi:hypothetical protein